MRSHAGSPGQRSPRTRSNLVSLADYLRAPNGASAVEFRELTESVPDAEAPGHEAAEPTGATAPNADEFDPSPGKGGR
jgi:hypothetical protein